MPYPFNGKLNQNDVNAALYNMIISQRVFGINVANTELADMFRVDGTMYGDTKLYSSFDIGAPESWLKDEEAKNLLELNRNKSGETQSIKMGKYQMIAITTDAYISKQAFMKEGTFAEFTAFLTGSLRQIKKVFDRALINSKIGTVNPELDTCKITIETPTNENPEVENRLEAQTIAARLVELKAEMEDNSRDYNDYGYMRSYDISDFVAVWNVKKHSKITKVDLPTIFHKDISATGNFKEFDLTEKWFGTVGEVELTLSESKTSEINSNNRVLESGWYDVSGDVVQKIKKPKETAIYLWAGDKVPYHTQQVVDKVRNLTVNVYSTKMPANSYYIVDKDVAFVLVHKNALPFMSGFQTGTQFWNARSLTSTNYLIWGYNELEFLKEYPRIKVKVVKQQP